jgi:hypothetical protein
MSEELQIPPLQLHAKEPASRVSRWLFSGTSLDHPTEHHVGHPWHKVLWLTGVDYFSTLGYQPGIALLAAGAISPIATLLLVLVTLFGALPIYLQVSRRSFAGQGSIAMLETLLRGWKSKMLVLVLLGFAATDFVITMTLSAADASLHLVENPFLHGIIGDHQFGITLVLLLALAVVFLVGFKEAIGLASGVAVPYLLLNAVVIARGLQEIYQHPEHFETWKLHLATQGDLTAVLLVAALLFPRLALGMSGFETGVSVMPLVDGDPDDAGKPTPEGRIRNTGKLLFAAAAIMSVYLLSSSFVTTLLIPEELYREGGPAFGRALAYLAHTYLGPVFGSIYDLSTILILWFAGASAMAGLLNIIPRYLPRFGMAPKWIAWARPLVLVLCAITLLVTWIFDANVEAQAGAYATGVLVLMTSAALAVALAFRTEAANSEGAERRGFRIRALAFSLVTAVFVYTLADNVMERHDGVIIAAFFILVVLGVGAASRTLRSTELRVAHGTFADEKSKALWASMVNKKVALVPLRTSSSHARHKKAQEIRRHYNEGHRLAFLHVNLADNRSEFAAPLRIKVRKEGEGRDCDMVIEVSGAVAIANTIAYVSELIDPISLFLGLTRQNLMTQAFKYLLWGEGETGLMVYMILLRHWDSTPEDDVRPLIFLWSE